MTPTRPARKKIKGKVPPPTRAAIALGSLLASLRKSAKLSQVEIADRLGVHRNSVYRFEKGEPMPLELFFPYCEATGFKAANVIASMVELLNKTK